MDRALLLYLLAQKDIEPKDLEDILGWSPGTRLSRITHGRGWRVDELRTLVRLGFTKDEIWQIFFGKEEER